MALTDDFIGNGIGFDPKCRMRLRGGTLIC